MSGPDLRWLPRYHVTATRNWINDPNGPIHHDGTYHLFFQENPHTRTWGVPRWGHVTSTDLVRWRRQPPAVEPDGIGADRDGCWSGCARVVNGRPAIYYTGIVGLSDADRVESVCRAVGSPDLLSWRKDPAPLIAGPPPGLHSGYHRDPFLWRDGAGWHLLLGSGTLGDDRHGEVVVYHSDDAERWRYAGVWFAGPRRLDGTELGQHWECPQLLRFDDADVLVLSCQVPGTPRPLAHAVAYVGRAAPDGFQGSFAGVLEPGGVFYAPAATVDASGRTLLWGWIQEELPLDLQLQLPLVGALSLPRLASVDDGRLVLRPAPELTGLRVGGPLAGPVDVSGRVVLVDAYDPQLEVVARVSGGSGSARWTIGPVRVEVDADSGVLTVADAARAAVTGLLRDAELRIFVDGSIVEVFLSGQPGITARCYESPEGPIVAEADGLDVRGCTIWGLGSAF